MVMLNKVLKINLTQFSWRFVVRGLLILQLALIISACGVELNGSLMPVTSEAATLASSPPVTDTAVPENDLPVLEPPTLTLVPTAHIEAVQMEPSSTVELLTSPVVTSTQALLIETLVSPTAALEAEETTTIVPVATETASPIPETPQPTEEGPAELVANIGYSALGNPLEAYQFGNGPNHIVVVGGIHGGYEWNTILLAYEQIAYFRGNPFAIPDSVTLTIIPVANPDGLKKVTGKTGYFSELDLAADTVPGRFNANNVDLNRNWDCQWKPTGTWRGNEVSGGSSAFSEPATVVLRDYLVGQHPNAVIFLHSAANGVFASGCPDTHQPSMDLARVYGNAGGYPVYESFSAYEVTGDAGDWLTTQGITAISVELINHQDKDYDKNLAGLLAVLKQYE